MPKGPKPVDLTDALAAHKGNAPRTGAAEASANMERPLARDGLNVGVWTIVSLIIVSQLFLLIWLDII